MSKNEKVWSRMFHIQLIYQEFVTVLKTTSFNKECKDGIFKKYLRNIR
jgi:hypothetical protein